MNLSEKLLGWFYKNGRDMPWRVKGGAHFDPYAVWISEIMLQQTTVKTVVDYFVRWMKRFPDIQTLANADIQDPVYSNRRYVRAGAPGQLRIMYHAPSAGLISCSSSVRLEFAACKPRLFLYPSSKIPQRPCSFDLTSFPDKRR